MISSSLAFPAQWFAFTARFSLKTPVSFRSLKLNGWSLDNVTVTRYDPVWLGLILQLHKFCVFGFRNDWWSFELTIIHISSSWHCEIFDVCFCGMESGISCNNQTNREPPCPASLVIQEQQGSKSTTRCLWNAPTRTQGCVEKAWFAAELGGNQRLLDWLILSGRWALDNSARSSCIHLLLYHDLVHSSKAECSLSGARVSRMVSFNMSFLSTNQIWHFFDPKRLPY